MQNVSGPAASAGGSLGGDGGGDPPRRLSAAEKGKGKKLATKKRKTSDREAEVAEAVVAAAEAAQRGGRLGALRIGADLTPRQRRVVLEAEALHGSPPGTIMLGGKRVRIAVRDLAQEDPDMDTEAEAQAEGPTEGQQQEQPLRWSTRARTQAIPQTCTQGQSTSAARSTPARGTPAPRQAQVRIHKDYTQVSAREIQAAFSSFSYLVSSHQRSESQSKVSYNGSGGYVRGTSSLTGSVQRAQGARS